MLLCLRWLDLQLVRSSVTRIEESLSIYISVQDQLSQQLAIVIGGEEYRNFDNQGAMPGVVESGASTIHSNRKALRLYCATARILQKARSVQPQTRQLKLPKKYHFGNRQDPKPEDVPAGAAADAMFGASSSPRGS